MRRVLVVCGAGASSTFLVHWMRRDAAQRGLDLAIDAGSTENLPSHLRDTDIVLVGSHLADAFDGIRSQASEAGVAAALLPALALTRAGGAAAIEIALEGSNRTGIAEPGIPTHSTTEKSEDTP